MSLRVTYLSKEDILALRFGDPKGLVADDEVAGDVHVAVDERGKVIEIEFLHASKRFDLGRLLPVEYPVSARPRKRQPSMSPAEG